MSTEMDLSEAEIIQKYTPTINNSHPCNLDSGERSITRAIPFSSLSAGSDVQATLFNSWHYCISNWHPYVSTIDLRSWDLFGHSHIAARFGPSRTPPLRTCYNMAGC